MQLKNKNELNELLCNLWKSTWKSLCPLRIRISSTCLDKQRIPRWREEPSHKTLSATLGMRHNSYYTHIFIIIHIIFTSEGCPTRPPRRWRLHVALGHFGEGVQLPHQAQSFPPGQTPHVRVQDATPPRPPPTKHQSTSGLQASDLWPLTLWLLTLRMQIFTLWGKQYFSFRRIHLIDKSSSKSYPFITWS